MKIRLLVPCLPVLLFCAGTDLRAEKLYRWVDQHGKVTYQDHPPPKDAARVEEKELGEANIVPPSELADDGAREERGEKRARPSEASRAGRRSARSSDTTEGRTDVIGLTPDDIRGAAVAEEDVPASVITPGGNAAGSAQPGSGAGEAAGGGAAGGGATAPGAVIPPLPVPTPLGP